jgi:pimeloyl-ACP methyl ester carboxylesterase
LGYSQGGGVALQLALRHPHLVSKLVVVSATYRRDGWYPEVLHALSTMTADDVVETPIGEAFRGHTPDPEAFVAYVDKVRVLNHEDQHISDDAMRGITATTMVIVGDADGVRPQHAVDMFMLRGGGDPVAAATGEIAAVPPARLVILPATSHLSIGHADAVLAPMIGDFLDDVPPPNPTLF